MTFLDKNQCECLNENDQHPWSHALQEGSTTYLESDADAQLILVLTFNQVMTLHGIRMRGPSLHNAPRHIRLFTNVTTTPDFDFCESTNGDQDIELLLYIIYTLCLLICLNVLHRLSAKHYNEDVAINLSAAKFKRVTNIVVCC